MEEEGLRKRDFGVISVCFPYYLNVCVEGKEHRLPKNLTSLLTSDL